MKAITRRELCKMLGAGAAATVVLPLASCVSPDPGEDDANVAQGQANEQVELDELDEEAAAIDEDDPDQQFRNLVHGLWETENGTIIGFDDSCVYVKSLLPEPYLEFGSEPEIVIDDRKVHPQRWLNIFLVEAEPESMYHCAGVMEINEREMTLVVPIQKDYKSGIMEGRTMICTKISDQCDLSSIYRFIDINKVGPISLGEGSEGVTIQFWDDGVISDSDQVVRLTDADGNAHEELYGAGPFSVFQGHIDSYGDYIVKKFEYSPACSMSAWMYKDGEWPMDLVVETVEDGKNDKGYGVFMWPSSMSDLCVFFQFSLGSVGSSSTSSLYCAALTE